jgi:DNA topoisomerase-1
MTDEVQVVAGECTTTFQGDRAREHRGEVLVVVKPDGTVLVHDADGYQPVAWLTRAESVHVLDDVVTAQDGDQQLRVDVHDRAGAASHPISRAGVPVGGCPDCDGRLVLAGGTVTCLGCDAAYGLPRDAAVLDETCADCGLPRLRVERGERVEVCLDRDCESLDERVRAAFDREWDCPACNGDLLILRRGGLIAGCEQYPDCDTGFSLPAGVVDGRCDCGLPAFETPTGRRCLDGNCERA